MAYNKKKMPKGRRKKLSDLEDKFKQYMGIPPYNTPDNDKKRNEFFFSLIVRDYEQSDIVEIGITLKEEYPEYF